ncbi:MAG: hypothetical protein JW818_14790 [Pirellulales bacterium]|nr:hypothetical protein [Pirellulales bacterium]
MDDEREVVGPPLQEHDDVPRERRWYRTVILFVVLVATFAVLLLPGKLTCRLTTDTSFPYPRHEVVIDYGWPFCYLCRKCSSKTGCWQETEGYVGPTFREYWTFLGRVERFEPAALLADLGVILLCAFGVLVVIRWLRRHPGKFGQFRLRTLLLAFVPIACLCSWWKVNYDAFKKEENCLGTLTKLGTLFRRLNDPTPGVVRELAGPDWVRSLIDMPKLKQFDRVVALDCAGRSTEVGEGRFVNFMYINHMQLEKLSSLPSLRILSFNHNIGVTDYTIQYLEGLDRLEVLDLSGTLVGAEGLAHLDTFPALHTLYLISVRMGDHTLEPLRQLKGLECLDLTYTNLRDNGAQDLNDLRLKRLCLRGTELTDEGLERLTDLPCLEEIDLRDTAVSCEGVAQWKAKHPNTKVIWAEDKSQ